MLVPSTIPLLFASGQAKVSVIGWLNGTPSGSRFTVATRFFAALPAPNSLFLMPPVTENVVGPLTAPAGTVSVTRPSGVVRFPPVPSITVDADWFTSQPFIGSVGQTSQTSPAGSLSLFR